ncbi:hypothetical protein PROFUN_04391 [Planoprotostelium fungivorum]|uniref:RRM Nup35-type domain-containing protein n=1 Tax=Planoprotostelium fungivorum TaxID=1890364 RepID=A0A2P6NHV0_9EUKA|nr:hypothetical protein PROFUN_04391 [Planoprotostelium fungivorum]
MDNNPYQRRNGRFVADTPSNFDRNASHTPISPLLSTPTQSNSTHMPNYILSTPLGNSRSSDYSQFSRILTTEHYPTFTQEETPKTRENMGNRPPIASLGDDMNFRPSTTVSPPVQGLATPTRDYNASNFGQSPFRNDSHLMSQQKDVQRSTLNTIHSYDNKTSEGKWISVYIHNNNPIATEDVVTYLSKYGQVSQHIVEGDYVHIKYRDSVQAEAALHQEMKTLGRNMISVIPYTKPDQPRVLGGKTGGDTTTSTQKGYYVKPLDNYSVEDSSFWDKMVRYLFNL